MNNVINFQTESEQECDCPLCEEKFEVMDTYINILQEIHETEGTLTTEDIEFVLSELYNDAVKIGKLRALKHIAVYAVDAIDELENDEE